MNRRRRASPVLVVGWAEAFASNIVRAQNGSYSGKNGRQRPFGVMCGGTRPWLVTAFEYFGNMLSRPLIIVVSVAFVCCVTVEEKPARLTLNTVPPGATVEVKRGDDRFEPVGASPVDIEVSSYQYDRTAQRAVSFLTGASALMAGGFALAAGSSEDKTPPTITAVALAVAAVIGFVASYPDAPKGSPPEGLAEPIAVRFSKPGYREETFVVNNTATDMTGPAPKILHTLSKEKQERRPPAPSATDPVVAVLRVHDKSDGLDGNLLRQLQSYFTARLGFYGYRTVPTEQINAAIKELQRESFRPCYDDACQIEIGRALAAQRTVAPSILQIGELCVAAAGVYDLKTEAATSAATEETGCSPKELMQGFDRVARRLRPAEPVFEAPEEDPKEEAELPPWATQRWVGPQ